MPPGPFGSLRAISLAVAVAILSGCRTPPRSFPSDVVRADIGRHCREATGGPALVAVTEHLLAGDLLERFYAPRGFDAAWSRGGALSPDADALLAALGKAPEDGLRSDDYHHDRLAALATAARRRVVDGESRTARARLLGSLDVLLTDAFFLYAAHLSKGKTDAQRGEPRWNIAETHADLPGLLATALKVRSVGETLDRLTPHHEYYRGLRRAREILGGQSPISRPESNAASDQLRKIELNMDRWRSLPHDLGNPYVFVDVAGFELLVVETARPIIRTRIVVGNAAWQTRDFSSEITHVVVNPYWNAPRHVLLAELIGYMRQDPNYLAANKMTLLRAVDGHEQPVDPATLDLAQVDATTLDFRLRQDPGSLNVLGRLLFRLPNPYNIYLHDTPYREDFEKSSRVFSHGCVRIERAEDVALFLLRQERGWGRARLASVVATDKERVVTLTHPTPTHVAYLTAWADAAGRMRFVRDVYGRDAEFDAAFRQAPPR